MKEGSSLTPEAGLFGGTFQDGSLHAMVGELLVNSALGKRIRSVAILDIYRSFFVLATDDIHPRLKYCTARS
jgi:hypothetical protein